MNKKILVFSLVILLFSTFMAAEQDIVITVSGTYYNAADSDFKDQFGKSKYFPEGKLALRLKGNLYIWGSAGFFSTSNSWEEWSNKGVIEADVEGKRVLDKFILCGGLGYYVGFLRKSDFSVRLELGACNITNSIETTKDNMVSGEHVSTENDKEKGLGIRGNLGVTYGLNKNFFGEASIGYMYAPDKINDSWINLGGFRLSLGLGLVF